MKYTNQARRTRCALRGSGASCIPLPAGCELAGIVGSPCLYFLSPGGVNSAPPPASCYIEIRLKTHQNRRLGYNKKYERKQFAMLQTLYLQHLTPNLLVVWRSG